MMNNFFKFSLVTIGIIFSITKSFGQIFEGWITYKIEAVNPDTTLIDDSTWQLSMKEVFGEQKHIIQRCYYKRDRYIADINAGKQNGWQAYNVTDKLLYSWNDNNDTAITVDTKKSLDPFLEIKDNDMTDTILDIPCKSVTLTSRFGQMTLWYNTDYFKIDSTLFEGYKYGHWEQIAKRIGCLPLKIRQEGLNGSTLQTAISYKKESINDDIFKIPEFKTVIKNPIN